MMRVYAILLTMLCTSCAGSQSATRIPIDGIYTLINQYVLPAKASPELEQTIRKSSQTKIRMFDKYGRFLIVYANVRNDTHPYGIRSISGGNGPNFVFRLENQQAVLVYHNGRSVENRIELTETEEGLFLYSHAHIGLTSGPPQRIQYRWDGAEFVYCD